MGFKVLRLEWRGHCLRTGSFAREERQFPQSRENQGLRGQCNRKAASTLRLGLPL